MVTVLEAFTTPLVVRATLVGQVKTALSPLVPMDALPVVIAQRWASVFAMPAGRVLIALCRIVRMTAVVMASVILEGASALMASSVRIAAKVAVMIA